MSTAILKNLQRATLAALLLVSAAACTNVAPTQEASIRAAQDAVAVQNAGG